MVVHLLLMDLVLALVQPQKLLDDGCLEIQSRDWDAIHITTTCPNNTTPTDPCGVTFI